jgi:ABC-type sugar transport system ATPase subunit
MLEIMRALVADHVVFIMDEPTASLGPPERAKLFQVARDLRKAGRSIIYISHDLDEVLNISDRISVMRGGELVRSAPTTAWTKASLVDAMVGDVRGLPARQPQKDDRRELLHIESLTVPGRIDNVKMTLYRGEILGIAGLVGSGRSELLRAIAGVEENAVGRIVVDGRARALFHTAREAVDAGIAIVPEDRKNQGIIALLSGATNVVLSDLWAVSRFGIIQSERLRRRAGAITRPLGFASDRLQQAIGTLSGGNQQKLLIGRCLHRNPKIILLDEPTRGIDVGAKAEIFATIRMLAAQGVGVILVSSEIEEVVEHADRVLVLVRGTVVASLDAANATVEGVLTHIFAAGG